LSSLNFERVSHILSPEYLQDKKVVQVGLGSGGAPVCDHLVMNGVRRWDLFDPDTLDDVNLVKHPRMRADLGRYKVEIQREWILDRNPDVQVFAHSEDVFSSGHFRECVRTSSLVLCCADKPDVRLFVGDVARMHSTPCITASVYRQGFGGEVYAYQPGQTGCFACLERAAEDLGININDSIQPTPEEEEQVYGLNKRDFQASGLSLDIQAVSLLQARVALSILTLGAPRSVAMPQANWLIHYNRPIPGIEKSGFNKTVALRVKPRKDCPCSGGRELTKMQSA
jgi:molybdopterin/thiamine biosynthesis adenylyltransferase